MTQQVVRHISVTNFGTITVRKLQSGGLTEFDLDLKNSAALSVVQRAFNSVPNTRHKSISSYLMRLDYKVPRKIKGPKRRQHVEQLTSDLLMAIELAARSPEVQSLIKSNPVYKNDPRLAAR